MAWLVVTNRTLIHEQHTVVTPVTYNAPFAISEAKTDTEYFQMTMLSLLALHFNIVPETVDSNRAFLIAFAEPDVQVDFVKVLDEEAAQIKTSDMNSTFCTTEVDAYPAGGRIDICDVPEM